ncbi:MAG: YqeG family HAD IIIA-type phosphatase [Lactobacillales bacterium]|jgi:HAD superfamily phosphatase (TIGR01668 family)|nr:YqeG family HAD IIIA-type phosphatase [Lactobacillales bacterium]
MRKKYEPTWLIESIVQLTPEMLKVQGIKAVLADLDNTMIAWNNLDGTKEIHQWLKEMKAAGVSVIVVSNNKTSRVSRAVAPLGVDFVSWSMKPFCRGINVAQRKLRIEKKEMVMVGDQLMTDILAANRSGIRSILVKPIVESDSFITKFNRARERRILKKLAKTDDLTYKKGIR